MCIDDHLSGLIGRRMLLEEQGYKVLEATGGREALALFQSNKVNAVIVDYHMPDTNGAALAEQIKTLNAKVPIMLLSAFGPFPERKLKAIDTYLSKSESPDKFVEAVEGLVSSRQRFFTRWLGSFRSRIGGLRKPAHSVN